MPLRIFQSASPSFEELYDAVLLAMASSYPHLTQGQESRLKMALIGIIEEPDLRDRDPAELMRLFQQAIDGI